MTTSSLGIPRATGQGKETPRPSLHQSIRGARRSLTSEAAVLELQRQCGNAAVQRLVHHHMCPVARREVGIQRDDSSKTSDVPTTLRMRDPLEELHVALERTGKGPWWGLIAGLPAGKPPSASMLRLVPDEVPRDGPRPTQMVFGPLSTDNELSALTATPSKPSWFERMLRPESLEEEAASESKSDLYLVYSNDGGGVITNQGVKGSDQGFTAGAKGSLEFNKHGTGLSRIGLTIIEMVTPRPTLPPGATFGPESTYKTAKGPYSGIASVDIGVTVHRSGGNVVELLGSVGVDSPEWGKFAQDIIHKEVSKSPLLEWTKGTKPLLEAGVRGQHTKDNVLHGDFLGLRYSGRLELDASVLTGTRRTEAEAGGRLVIRTAKVRTALGKVWLEFSPVGVYTRGFMRYNDGREQPLTGVEAAVRSSLMLNFGRLGVGLAGTTTVSTDPAFQTPNEAGSAPTAHQITPFVGPGYGMPAGHHSVGHLILRIGF